MAFGLFSKKDKPPTPAAREQEAPRFVPKQPAPAPQTTIDKINAVEADMGLDFTPVVGNPNAPRPTAPVAPATGKPNPSRDQLNTMDFQSFAKSALKEQAQAKLAGQAPMMPPITPGAPQDPLAASQPMPGKALTPQEKAAQMAAMLSNKPAPAPEEHVSTDLMLGATSMMNSMEIADSTMAPVIEEAAVLYANGQTLAAMQVIQAAVAEDHLGASTLQAWQMLFELYQMLGKHAEFEALGIDYAARFEASPPSFAQPKQSKDPKTATNSGSSFVSFTGTLDTSIVPQLEKLKKLAEKNPTIRIDFSKIKAVDASGCELLLKVFAAFRKSKHELLVTSAENLVKLLKDSIEVGRVDPTSHCWMLLLEMYRLLNKQAEFEEAAIDYCVTFEVSPPSWEPPLSNIKLDNTAPPVEEEPAAPAVDPNVVILSGEVEGRAEIELGRIMASAAARDQIVIDCSELKRVDFTAAGNFVNTLFGLPNKRILFRNVNHLVAALFTVMGITEVATVERRKL